MKDILLHIIFTTDWTAVITIAGVVFSIFTAIATARIGNVILGKYTLKTRKYELFFEQQNRAYSDFFEVAIKILTTRHFNDDISQTFELTCYKAKLFFSDEISSEIDKLEPKIVMFADHKIDDIHGIMDSLNKITAMMREELRDKSENCR